MPRISPLSLIPLLLSMTPAAIPAQIPVATALETASVTAATSVAAPADMASPAGPVSVSQVRIVRLSEIRGAAQLDRNTGLGFEPAFANIPITKGSKLRTSTGLAEVEFEDNSTLRLTPDSEVDFTELGRSSAGSTLTQCKVVKGMVYVTLAKGGGAAFSLLAAGATLRPSPASHLRLDLADAPATLSVMAGSVDFAGPAGSTIVTKKRTLILGTSFATAQGVAPGTPAVMEQPALTVADKIQPAPFDSWDKQGNEYQSRYANAAFSGGAGSLYGSSDLNYYGSFGDIGGCGTMWRPYFANAAWDPFAAGTWAMYPGAGYSFISPYPWGWLPFHSGSWQQCGAAGWGWSPGGQWNGLRNLPTVHGPNRVPSMPLRPPVGTASLVPVGTKTLAVSQITAPGTFTFRQNSAGLGVPRETFGKLGRTSVDVGRHGSAATDAGLGFVGTSPAVNRPSEGRGGGVTAPAAVMVITRFSPSSKALSSPVALSTGAPPSMQTASRASSYSAPASASSAHAGAGGHK